ncbi:MAG: Eco47II family restriction endonuclease [Campylobacterota bacterium]|nr:Eco47II family restriction endonuclease [Campylobacterota bacterium]
MRAYNLGFIADTDLFNHVKETVNKYRFSIDLNKFNKNLIDPIKLTFDSKVYHKSIEEVVEAEIIRQMDKSNTNHIGYFHQNIFKYMNSEWEVPKKGFDLINETEKIYVEMKNKHNTMNSASSQKTYMKMQSTLLKNADNRCFLVEIIAKHSQNTPWKVSIDGDSHEHDFIRRISIDKFYELVTGETEAFKDLCEVLPKVIEDVLEEIETQNMENSVLEELSGVSPDILKSLYLLSFNKYEGFNHFNFEVE